VKVFVLLVALSLIILVPKHGTYSIYMVYKINKSVVAIFAKSPPWEVTSIDILKN
jgi:hypothetical protein